MSDIEDTVKQSLADSLGLDKEKIDLKAKLVEDLGADSLDMVELVINLEDQFHINIDDRRADEISTVADVVNLIENSMESE